MTSPILLLHRMVGNKSNPQWVIVFVNVSSSDFATISELVSDERRRLGHKSKPRQTTLQEHSQHPMFAELAMPGHELKELYKIHTDGMCGKCGMAGHPDSVCRSPRQFCLVQDGANRYVRAAAARLSALRTKWPAR